MLHEIERDKLVALTRRRSTVQGRVLQAQVVLACAYSSYGKEMAVGGVRLGDSQQLTTSL